MVERYYSGKQSPVNSLRTDVFLERFRKCILPGNGRIEKLMVPSESASQELSNEWSCQHDNLKS
jgi:hypothetical protein